MIISIDPAQNGAAILWQEGNPIVVLSWKQRTKNKKPYYSVQKSIKIGKYHATQNDIPCRNGAEIALQFFWPTPLSGHMGQITHLVCEDAFVFKNPKSGLRVARFGGAFLGSLIASCYHYDIPVGESHFAMATEWRARLLGLPVSTPSDRCKEASLAAMPLRIPAINWHLGHHGHLDHITDACGVGEWLMRTKGLR